MSPADELRAAADSLRNIRNCEHQDLDSDSLELLQLVGKLLRARKPLIELLDNTAEQMDLNGLELRGSLRVCWDAAGKRRPDWDEALATARAILGSGS